MTFTFKHETSLNFQGDRREYLHAVNADGVSCGYLQWKILEDGNACCIEELKIPREFQDMSEEIIRGIAAAAVPIFEPYQDDGYTWDGEFYASGNITLAGGACTEMSDLAEDILHEHRGPCL